MRSSVFYYIKEYKYLLIDHYSTKIMRLLNFKQL
jgi:hypothetical protein